MGANNFCLEQKRLFLCPLAHDNTSDNTSEPCFNLLLGFLSETYVVAHAQIQVYEVCVVFDVCQKSLMENRTFCYYILPLLCCEKTRYIIQYYRFSVLSQSGVRYQ